MRKTLINQPSAKPVRKWQAGALISVILTAALAGLQVYDATLFTTWSPVILVIAGQLGFAIPAYMARDAV